MKVERQTDFQPITITLESQQEADLLWHLLNMPTKIVEEWLEKVVRERRGLNRPNSAKALLLILFSLKSEMFDVFDRKYFPKE